MKKQQNKKDVLTFQEMIEKLNSFWGERGCVIAQPYGVEVGAGTANPMTFFRVLGPEPLNVAYVEPSRRPDDGRYGQNPNRLQHYYQYQIILKPAPLFNQELYIESLRVLGIDPKVHDIRFVEDNWESPAIGAWGLGWEVWLDGMEISQYTYFQQVAGIPLDVPVLEITLGLERLAMYIQGVEDYRDIMWNKDIKYGDLFEQHEYWQSKHNYETASIDDVRKLYEINERQVEEQLEKDNYWAAYDYLLKISHLFNILDSRGVISVTDRVSKFGMMGKFSQQVGCKYLLERESLGYPILGKAKPVEYLVKRKDMDSSSIVTDDNKLVLELYFEELPAEFVINWKSNFYGTNDLEKWFADQGVKFSGIKLYWGPRRIVLVIDDSEKDIVVTKKISGPLKSVIYNNEGNLTPVGIGFLKKNGLEDKDLKIEVRGQKEFVYADVVLKHSYGDVLKRFFDVLITSAPQSKTMNWNGNKSESFVRPLRNVFCMLNDSIVDVGLWGVKSSEYTYYPRGVDVDTIGLKSSGEYLLLMKKIGIVLDETYRRGLISEAVYRDQDKYDYSENTEAMITLNTYLTEFPSVYFARLDEKYDDLPIELVKKVLESNQKYIVRVLKANTKVVEYGIVVNKSEASKVIVDGNKKVVTSRLDDALFYWNLDVNGKSLLELRDNLKHVLFHPKIGSYYQKVERVKELVKKLKDLSEISVNESDLSKALDLIKNDRATQMVNEFASLEGVIGAYYARRQGYSQDVAKIVSDHYLPTSDSSPLPKSIEAELIGIADRVDNIASFALVGGLPKGSSDPYEIRKFVYSLVRLLREGHVSIDLRSAFDFALSSLGNKKEGLLEEIIAFIDQRIYQLLKSETEIDRLAYGVAFAGDQNIRLKYQNFEEFKSLMTNEEEVNRIFDTIKRVSNILKDFSGESQISDDMIEDGCEKELRKFDLQKKVLVPQDIIRLSSLLEEYFKNVRVNVEDVKVKNNRLALLSSIDKKVRQLFAA